MNRGILDVRLAAVLFILLLGSVAFIRTENLGVVAEQVSNKVPCSSCPLASSSTPQVLNMTVLEGEEKNKAIATALSSEDYKNVKKLFPDSVYDLIRDNATAGIVNLELNGTKYEISAVFVPFKAEAGLEAGIVFMTIEGHTLAMGVVVNLQYGTPVFAAMSMDSKAIVIPLQGSGSCRSCGSGVSPLIDQCSEDWECIYEYGEGWCCIDYQCQPCECYVDYDCEQLYGSGYCCVNRQCQLCPPPPYSSCELCLWICEYAKALGCGVAGMICMYALGKFCAIFFPLWEFCIVVMFLICTLMLVTICWWLEYTGYVPSCYEICTWAGYCP